MTKQQLKAEIEKALNEVPEAVLQDILDYLNEVKTKEADKVQMARYLKQILQEDKELLEKLAK